MTINIDDEYINNPLFAKCVDSLFQVMKDKILTSDQVYEATILALKKYSTYLESK
jgi:hypothetical protein